jgi:hypothetical protein
MWVVILCSSSDGANILVHIATSILGVQSLLLARRWIQQHAATLQSITSQKTVGSTYFFLKFNRMVFTLYCWHTFLPHSVAISCPSEVWLSVCIHCSSKTYTHMHPMHVQNTYWTVFMDISLHGKHLKKNTHDWNAMFSKCWWRILRISTTLVLIVDCIKNHTQLKMKTNETMNFRYNAQKIMLKWDDITRFQVLTVMLLKMQVCWKVTPQHWASG